eukprot:TRINITY_DN12947_c0_g1_i1.p1 TRINITY_DN12947_c0_g1~~TRINITY_DN12947_c0_g1_i1.p1  ORF type:complete len:211 (+),score=34.14 TRINITY_DN12947_c0_g1_i1:50-682(+)
MTTFYPRNMNDNINNNEFFKKEKINKLKLSKETKTPSNCNRNMIAGTNQMAISPLPKRELITAIIYIMQLLRYIAKFIERTPRSESAHRNKNKRNRRCTTRVVVDFIQPTRCGPISCEEVLQGLHHHLLGGLGGHFLLSVVSSLPSSYSSYSSSLLPSHSSQRLHRFQSLLLRQQIQQQCETSTSATTSTTTTYTTSSKFALKKRCPSLD